MLFLCTLIFSLLCVASCQLVATSTHDMQRVLEGEDHLLNDLRMYIDAVEQKLKNIRIVLKDAMQREQEALLDPLGFVSNPLNSFPMVRRMHKDVPALYNYLKREEGEDLQQIADYRLEIIAAGDVKHAAEELLRIQRIHELDERDMAKGLLQNEKYKAKLNTQDCMYLGRLLSKKGEQQLATKWMELALEQFNETPEIVLQQFALNRSSILKERNQLQLPRARLEEL
ncbi:prolyl 4-hydroxylase subunit alpha-1 [Drosophila nasuta]|uniref:prolyl 4-hydroxylase subunit alpha-1 n=1 Tax=Drosophila nasuta TaxID=42062 RepID=UPI00295EC6D5|nr:prolyl 4-hydroxylase subunit alpha-1 [Drosophila nasuta]